MANNFGLVLVLLLNVNIIYCIEDYCSIHNYPINRTSTFLQFTKEPSVEEFAIAGQFKGLHCCAKGYRSIEWYKDGKPYPWPLMVSQLILYPESANQTVYAQTVSEADAGNYTCVLRKDSVVHSHTIHLTVFEKVPDDIKITYISQNTQAVIGHSVRLFCESFAGRVDLPDAHNEAVWLKADDHNGTLDDDTRIRQEKIFRENGQTFGIYLIIDNVQEDDFGEYICKISKPGQTKEITVTLQEKKENQYHNPNEVPVAQLLIISGIIMGTSVLIAVAMMKFALPLRVYFKDSFGPLDDTNGKTADILIAYNSKDSELTLGVLLPMLENKYNYTCGSRQLPENVSSWYASLQSVSQKYRRVVAVISPASLQNNWNSASVFQAIKQLQGIDPKVCCVLLKELPTAKNEVKNNQGETLSSLARTLNVIVWERSNDNRFWLSLRLRLPRKRTVNVNVESRITAQGENTARLTSDSQESLDILV